MPKKIRDERIDSDPDFILSPKHGNSLKRFMDDYPDGAPDGVICRALDMSQETLQDTFESAIVKLRRAMGAPDQDDV